MDVRRPPDGVTVTAQTGEREPFSGTWRAGVFPTKWYLVTWISPEPALQLEQICSIHFEFFVYLLFLCFTKSDWFYSHPLYALFIS